MHHSEKQIVTNFTFDIAIDFPKTFFSFEKKERKWSDSCPTNNQDRNTVSPEYELIIQSSLWCISLICLVLWCVQWVIEFCWNCFSSSSSPAQIFWHGEAEDCCGSGSLPLLNTKGNKQSRNVAWMSNLQLQSHQTYILISQQHIDSQRINNLSDIWISNFPQLFFCDIYKCTSTHLFCLLTFFFFFFFNL